jgi:hypothetical protein
VSCVGIHISNIHKSKSPNTRAELYSLSLVGLVVSLPSVHALAMVGILGWHGWRLGRSPGGRLGWHLRRLGGWLGGTLGRNLGGKRQRTNNPQQLDVHDMMT